jgi:hypothetical protein
LWRRFGLLKEAPGMGREGWCLWSVNVKDLEGRKGWKGFVWKVSFIIFGFKLKETIIYVE